MNFLEGQVLLIDKPLEWTSFDVVNKIRSSLKRHLNIKKIKVGHAGTLDPLATGLLVVCTGRETKNIEKYQAWVKEYETTIRLGATTPSFDLETEIDQEFPVDHISEEMVINVLKKFTGKISQIPPAFSAKKIDGQRAYMKARKNQNFELKPVDIVINSIDLLEFSNPDLKIRINCSKGTYVRSLARDIGQELHSGGHLTELRRTAIGDFNVKSALSIKEFEEKLK